MAKLHPDSRKLPFDFHTLEAFMVVCETGSMTKAAARLGVTQSAISHLMAQFEQTVGATLFDRTGRPIVATAAAKQLLPGVNCVLTEAHQLARSISVGQHRTTHLRIGMLDSLATLFVPRLIRELQQQAASFSISSGMSPRLQQQFLDWELDIFIGSNTLNNVAGLESHEILRENFVLITPKSYREVTDDISFRVLAVSHPFIRSHPETDLGIRIERHLRRLRLEIPRSLAFDTMESTIAMVTEGLGWTILPPISLRKHAAWDLARISPLPGPAFGRTVELVARQAEHAGLPEKMAVVTRRILKQNYLPALFRSWPWLKQLVNVSS